ASIAAGNERCARALNCFECVEDILVAGNLRRIALRPDQDEVVVHHWKALYTLPFGQKLFLGGLGMDEHDIGIAPSRKIERLACAQRDDADGNTRLFLEDREEISE